MEQSSQREREREWDRFLAGISVSSVAAAAAPAVFECQWVKVAREIGRDREWEKAGRIN